MEKTVYIHKHTPDINPTPEEPKNREQVGRPFSLRIADLFTKGAKAVAALGIVLLLISFGPSIWYGVVSGSSETVSKLLSDTAKKAQGNTASASVKTEYQPRVDPSLPKGATLKIPSIGVDTSVNEATIENYEDALENGVWRVSDFGTPYDRENPTILAAHRYGYLAWSNIFRKKASFYNLPELEKGDVVEVYWRQRKYVYEIYETSKGEEIEDYSADLILYTCESLNSPVRIFKYARLLQI